MTELNELQNLQDAWNLLRKLEHDGYNNEDFGAGSYPAIMLCRAQHYIRQQMQRYLMEGQFPDSGSHYLMGACTLELTKRRGKQ